MAYIHKVRLRRQDTCYCLNFEFTDLPPEAKAFCLVYDGDPAPPAKFASHTMRDPLSSQPDARYAFLDPKRVMQAKQLVIWLYDEWSSDGRPFDHIIIPNGFRLP